MVLNDLNFKHSINKYYSSSRSGSNILILMYFVSTTHPHNTSKCLSHPSSCFIDVNSSHYWLICVLKGAKYPRYHSIYSNFKFQVYCTNTTKHTPSYVSFASRSPCSAFMTLLNNLFCCIVQPVLQTDTLANINRL